MSRGPITGPVPVACETVRAAVYGRTLGMRRLHLRPLGTDGMRVGRAQAAVRALICWRCGLLGRIRLLHVPWCCGTTTASPSTTRRPTPSS